MMAGKYHLPAEGIGSRQNWRESYFLWNKAKYKSTIAEKNKLKDRNMHKAQVHLYSATFVLYIYFVMTKFVKYSNRKCYA